MSDMRPSQILGMILRALGLGLVMMIVVPLILAFGALALGHLAGGCGAGSSGGCEMGAAALGLYATVPGFVIGAGLSVFRELRKPRT
jgi:hypothetical protein